MRFRFHPLHFADALDVLHLELTEELMGKDAELALSLLRLEIVFAVDQARTWAAKHSVPFDFPQPDAECTARECILLLGRLREALRDLASRAAPLPMNDNAGVDGEDD